MTRTAVGTEDGDGDPLEGLVALEGRRRELFERERRLVMQARIAGVSWKRIGAALGVSGQAAHKKHRRDVP